MNFENRTKTVCACFVFLSAGSVLRVWQMGVVDYVCACVYVLVGFWVRFFLINDSRMESKVAHAPATYIDFSCV